MRRYKTKTNYTAVRYIAMEQKISEDTVKRWLRKLKIEMFLVLYSGKYVSCVSYKDSLKFTKAYADRKVA